MIYPIFNNSILLATLIMCMFILLIKYQQSTVLIFSLTMLICYLFGWFSNKELISNASNSGLVTLIFLMLIAKALEKTNILQKLKKILFRKTERNTLLRVIIVSAIASSILNNTAVVAVLISAIKSTKQYFPSRLLLPMSFATIMGGTLTLVGTSTNLVVNSMYIDIGNKNLGFFDFTPVSIVVTLLGCTTLYFTSLLLPKIKDINKNKFGCFIEAELKDNSSLTNKTIESAGLRHLDNLFLVEILRANGERVCPVEPNTHLRKKDKLIFIGDIEKITILSKFSGITTYAKTEGLNTKELTEVIIKETSPLKGETIKKVGFRALFDAAVIGIKRNGSNLKNKLGDIVLQAGDIIILATGRDFYLRQNLDKNFYIISNDIITDNVLLGWREKITILGFLAMLGYSVIMGTSLFDSSFILMAILLITKCLSIEEVRRSFPVNIWIIVTSSLCIANSMENTGLVQIIATFSENYLQHLGPYFIFIGVFIITILMTEFITNNAAAALMFPIAYSLAIGANIDTFPVILGVAFAASASFITPYGYQTNLMVFNASSYRWRDFILTGLPVLVVYILSCIIIIPIIYPL